MVEKNLLVAMAAPPSGPPSCTMVWEPCSSMASIRAVATSVNASSQVTRSHFPSPRSPARFIGYITRSEP
jgi:hypothetical protein